MSPAGVATPMLSYADSDEGVGRGLQQALLPTEGKIARERERERARERERERKRGVRSHFGSSAAPFVWGLVLPSFIGEGSRRVGLGCNPGRVLPVSLSGA